MAENSPDPFLLFDAHTDVDRACQPDLGHGAGTFAHHSLQLLPDPVSLARIEFSAIS
jgi:hypothetical protein